MEFEFDPPKSETNKAKHGIDFVEAQALWRSKHVLLGAKDALERRYLVIGRIGSEHWSAMIIYRGATIRMTVGEAAGFPGGSIHMKKSQADATTAKKLEEKFDHGEDVLDYFDLKKARVVDPQAKSSVQQKFRDSIKRNSQRRAVVREKSAGYRKKK